MARTENQRKGDTAEEDSIAGDEIFGNYEVEEAPKNNKGYDYKRRKNDTW